MIVLGTNFSYWKGWTEWYFFSDAGCQDVTIWQKKGSVDLTITDDKFKEESINLKLFQAVFGLIKCYHMSCCGTEEFWW